MQISDLPEEIIQRIARCLPQYDKVNWMLTNFQFYSQVQPILYEKIMITPAGLSPSKSSYRDSLCTVIGYLKTPLATDTLNQRVFTSRQQVFLQSLEVNPALCDMIKEITIYGFKSENGMAQRVTDIVLPELLIYLKSHCANIRKFVSLNTVPYEFIVPSLKRLDLHSLSSLNKCLNLEVEDLYIASQNASFDLHLLDNKKLITLFSNLRTLAFNDELAQALVVKYLLENEGSFPFAFENLKLIHYHSGNEATLECSKLAELILNHLDYTKLKSLELVLGCDDLICTCSENLINLLRKKPFLLNSLSIVQKTVQRDHNYSEKFDFEATCLIKALSNSEKIRKLSIRHSYPKDFNCVGGFEGNYLHRIEMYKNTLPLLTGLQTLIAPTFMQSVACYEQLMSDLLWNNVCQCKECQDYTNIFDDYIQNHQYFSDYGGRFVDMFTSFLFGNVGAVVAERLVNDSDMLLLCYPKLIRYWDFHSGDHEVIHIHEGVECGIDCTAFDPLGVVVDHFLRDYVKEIHQLQGSIQHVLMSGFFYDVESNWTSE